MTQEFEVSVEELLRTLKRRGIPLPSEMGAFITLEVCEQILDRPSAITTHEVAISEIGEVLCATELTPAAEDDAVRALLALLGDLLVCSAPGVPSMLLELVERDPSHGQCTLDNLRDDLEACLLPLNRGATRRVLARLLREARKAGPSQRAKADAPAATSGRPEHANLDDIDAQFDALLGSSAGGTSSPVKVRAKPIQQPGLRTPRGSFTADPNAASLPFARRDETPITVPMPGGVLASSTDSRGSRVLAPAAASALPETSPGVLHAHSDLPPTTPGLVASPLRESPAAVSGARRDETLELDSLLDFDSHDSHDSHDPTVPLVTQPASAHAAPSAQPTAARPAPKLRLHAGSDAEPTRGPRLRGGELDTDGLIEADAAPKRGGAWVLGVCLVASLGLVGAYLTLGREGARNALGLLPTNDAPTEKPVAPAKTKTPRGDLHITSTPDKAQVLLLIGPGPALATDLPLGVAQEFVAIADGYLPARAVMPADASWEDLEGKPRFELAIQARPAAGTKPATLGPTLLPRDVGSPQSRLGSVRVVTTPRGAKVYQLIGFTPDVRVENLPLDQSYEVLVALDGRAPVSQQLTAADFKPVDGKPTASIALDLGKK